MSFYGYDNDNDIENFIDDSLFSSLQTTNDISNEYFAHVKFDEPEFHFLVFWFCFPIFFTLLQNLEKNFSKCIETETRNE